MRAAVLAAYDTPLALEDVPEPVCPPDGVVLEVLACGVCRSDWHGWKGEHPRVKPGSIGGHEFCGTVLEAGPDAHWRPGDRVIAPFLLGCGRCPTCRTGQGHVCDDLVFPGLGSAGWAAGPSPCGSAGSVDGSLFAGRGGMTSF